MSVHQCPDIGGSGLYVLLYSNSVSLVKQTRRKGLVLTGTLTVALKAMTVAQRHLAATHNEKTTVQA